MKDKTMTEPRTRAAHPRLALGLALFLIACGGTTSVQEPATGAIDEGVRDEPRETAPGEANTDPELNLGLLSTPPPPRRGPRIASCTAPSRAPAVVPRPLEGDIGTAHPMWLRAAAPDGSYVAACQAREDTSGDRIIEVRFGRHGEPLDSTDTPQLYLMSASNMTGLAIDELMTADERGHRVVYRVGNDVHVLDTHAERDAILFSGSDAQSARMASMTADGERLVYVRAEGEREQVVLRNISDGAERVVEFEGRVWRAELSKGGHWLTASVVRADTNGDGVLSLPRRQTSAADGPCRGPAIASQATGHGGDGHVIEQVRLCDGARFTETTIARTRTGLLVKREDEGLVWIHSEGGETRLVPTACTNPRVLEVDVEARGVKVFCGADERGVIMLYRPGRAALVQPMGTVLDFGDPPSIVDEASDSRPPRRTLHAEGESPPNIIDSADGSHEVVLNSRSYVRHTWGSIVVLRARRDLTPFGPTVVIEQSGPNGAHVLGWLPQTPNAVLPNGHSLVAVPQRRPPVGIGDGPIAPQGPMRWVRPGPAGE